MLPILPLLLLWFFLLAPVLGQETPPPAGGAPAAPAPAAHLIFPGDANVFGTGQPVTFRTEGYADGALSLKNNLGVSLPLENRGKAAACPPLAPGFYHLYAAGREVGGFAVVIPPAEYPNDNDSAIGLVYAMNTPVLPKGVDREAFLRYSADLARRAGVRLVREHARTKDNFVRDAQGCRVIPNDMTTVALRVLHEAGIVDEYSD